MARVSNIWIYCSLVIALLVSTTSLLGILNPRTYSQETTNWALQAVGQDLGNLLVVITLVISTYFVTKKSSAAYLIWLGTFLYLIYAYLIYAFFIHFNYLFLLYVTILGLSTYTIIGGLVDQDIHKLTKFLAIRNIRTASILLILIGILFGFLWLSEIIPTLISGQIPQSAATAGLWVNPIHVIDLAFVLPGMILSGILLWKRKPLGYLLTAPWLTFAVLMGSSIVAYMMLEISKQNMEVLPPLLIIGSIVIASTVVLYFYLKQLPKQ